MATRYIKLFDTESQYDAFCTGAMYVEPHSSGIVATNKAHYNVFSNMQMQKIEYLQSSGTQYIDTEIIPNNNTGVHTYVIVLDDSDRYFIGLRNDSGNTRYAIAHSKYGFYYGWNNYQTTNRLTGTTGEFYLNFKNDRKFISIYNNSTLTSTLPTLFNSPSYPIWIFGSSGYSKYKALCKIYYVQISQENEIILDLVPVRVGNVGYMYDKINKQLFGNSGTGDFILGPDI